MEEQGDGGGEEPPPPFWNTTTVRSDGIASVFISSGTLLILLTAVALCFMVLVLPSSLSFKNSWESLNLLLVLVALLFGLLSRTRNNEQNEPLKSNPSTPNKWGILKDSQNSSIQDSNHHQWLPEFLDYQGYKKQFLRRNSSSFPDLRESSYTYHLDYRNHNRWGTFDDLGVDPGKRSETRQVHRRRRSSDEIWFPMEEGTLPDTEREKNLMGARRREAESRLATDRSDWKSSKNMGQSEKSGNKKERSDKKQDKDGGNLKPISTITPPEMKNSRSHKKRSVTEALPQPRHKLEAATASPPPPLASQKKKGRRKIPVPTYTPPAPPPPPPLSVSKIGQPETSSQPTGLKIHVPLELKYKNIEENTNTSLGYHGNLDLSPAEPPRPSFLKSPIWKFIVEGDYVRINSATSESPEPSEIDSDMTSAAAETVPAFRQPSSEICSSPDVNAKAETFITKFRAKLKLEKIHSLKRREMGLPSPGSHMLVNEAPIESNYGRKTKDPDESKEIGRVISDEQEHSNTQYNTDEEENGPHSQPNSERLAHSNTRPIYSED